jgi:hypothetical protein
MQSLEPAIYEVRAQGVKLLASRNRRNRMQARPEPTVRTMPASIPSAKIRVHPDHGRFQQNAVLLKRINVIWAVQSYL